jgi:hypothetical protein
LPTEHAEDTETGGISVDLRFSGSSVCSVG